MARQLIISEKAVEDLKQVRQWLTQSGSGPKARERLSQIRVLIQELRHTPSRWPMGIHPGVREVSAAGYRILYEVDRDSGDDRTTGNVMVLRVFGPGQNRMGVRS